MDKYRAMAVFVQVVERGSFSAAADKLGITKSAVSQQITLLEEDVGTRLLHRTTRRLNLTEAGEIYLAGCRQMVEAAEAANQQIGQFSREPSGTLRITCAHDFASHQLVPLLAPFMERYPNLSLYIDGSDQAINLVEEGIDLALRIGSLTESSLVARKIGDLPLMLVAAPSYLERHGVPQRPAELTNHQWVAFLQLAQPYQLNLQGTEGQRQKVRLYGRACSNSHASTREMVISGMGIGRFFEQDVARELEEGRLVQVLSNYRLEPEGLYVVYPHRAHVPLKVRAVINYLIENRAALGALG
jgi:LysR family transcriptional regulator, transcriptional activator for aaeXAB operon